MKFTKIFLLLLVAFSALLVVNCEEEVVDTTPPVVVLVSPEGGETFLENTTIIAEATDDNAIAEVDFFVDSVLIGEVTALPYELEWDVSNYADGNTHEIYVSATDASGNSTNSTSVLVTVMLQGPSLVLPANGDTINTKSTIDLKWLASDGAGDYAVYLSTSLDNFFSDIVFSSSNIADDSDTMTVTTSELIIGSYYWKVRRMNCDECSWSATWNFDITGLNSPELISPVSTEDNYAFITGTNMPTFEWSAVSNASEYMLQVSYEKIIDDGDDDNDGDTQEYKTSEIDTIVTGISYTSEIALDADTIYWKLKTKNAVDIWGDWAYDGEFAITGPFAPSLDLPIPHGVIYDTNAPEFSWTSVDYSVQYEIEMQDETETVFSNMTENTSIVFDGLAEGNYTWKLRAMNADSLWGDWSEEQNFRILTTIVEFEEDGFDWVTVSAGDYTYGEEDDILLVDTNFDLMKYEVTNEQYVTFLNERSSTLTIENGVITGFYAGDDEWDVGEYQFFNLDHEECRIEWKDSIFAVETVWAMHPVTQVTWFGAYAFADYYEYRLPTEQEWEKAARGATGYNYPFHDEIYPGNANYFSEETKTIGFYNGNNATYDSPSIFGAYDMAGNVSEWTSSFWNDNSNNRVRRGGSYVNNADYVKSWVREWSNPEGSGKHIGFRCVK